MIALLILSFGILAAVALQLVSKRNTIDADQQSTASYLAYGLVERIRANSQRDALITYSSAPELGRGSRGAAPPRDCRVGQCSMVQLAFYDLWDWERLLDGSLEQIDNQNTGGLTDPTACIAGPGGGLSGTYAITIAWRASTVLPNNNQNNCGAASGLYGNNNEYRRTLTVQAYVASR